MEPIRPEFGQMPGVNDNQMGPAFRELSEQDASQWGWVWPTVGVGVLVLVVGGYFLGTWLNWF